jgi:hypothetical protein
MIMVWAVALAVAWPALPWLELAVTGSRTEASMSDWVPSAEAQGKRRRRGKSRRKPRRSSQPAPRQEAAEPQPATGARPAAAADEPGPQPAKGGKEQVFDFTGLELGGQLRTPQLLYFLDRAAEELQRASLERRSFLPEMVRSIDEESL